MYKYIRNYCKIEQQYKYNRNFPKLKEPHLEAWETARLELKINIDTHEYVRDHHRE